MQKVSIVTMIAVVVISVAAAGAGFVEISLERLNGGDIGTLLATVIFAALVIERAVEVYINNAFNPQEMRLSRKIKIAQRQVEIAEEALTEETKRQAQPGATPDPSTLTTLRGEIAAARRSLLDEKEVALDDLTAHKDVKTAWAGAVSTILSLAAAAVGVRILGQFLPMDNDTLVGPLAQNCAVAVANDPNVAKIEDLSEIARTACEAVEFQLVSFRAADILLTTFVLAGGADGIHQIIKRFTNPKDVNT